MVAPLPPRFRLPPRPIHAAGDPTTDGSFEGERYPPSQKEAPSPLFSCRVARRCFHISRLRTLCAPHRRIPAAKGSPPHRRVALDSPQPPRRHERVRTTRLPQAECISRNWRNVWEIVPMTEYVLHAARAPFWQVDHAPLADPPPMGHRTQRCGPLLRGQGHTVSEQRAGAPRHLRHSPIRRVPAVHPPRPLPAFSLPACTRLFPTRFSRP